jgi:hypothetical protein
LSEGGRERKVRGVASEESESIGESLATRATLCRKAK